MDLGEWVRTNRTRCGWTQLELSLRLRVNHGCVSRWERGVHLPDLPQFRQLCVAFGSSADEALRLKSPANKRARARPAVA